MIAVDDFSINFFDELILSLGGFGESFIVMKYSVSSLIE